MNPHLQMSVAAYRKAATSVHPSVAVVRLYDETILAVTQAIRAKQAGDHEGAFVKVLRAATILRGLSHSLDFAKGGAVSERLFSVYKRYILLLHVSYGKPDVVARYRKLLEGLGELRDAWASIAGMPPRDFVPEIDPDTRASLAALAAGAAVAPPRGARPEGPAAVRNGRAERLRRRNSASNGPEPAPLGPKGPGGRRGGHRERPFRLDRPAHRD
jgi:flagellar protein FliS